MNFTRIDTKKLIARFGGRIELWRRLKARGFELSVKTIEKWSERDSIPAYRLVQMMELAQSEKKPLNLNDYIQKAPNASKELSHNRHDHEKDQVRTDG